MNSATVTRRKLFEGFRDGIANLSCQELTINTWSLTATKETSSAWVTFAPIWIKSSYAKRLGRSAPVRSSTRSLA
jgi:hypothetical protein